MATVQSLSGTLTSGGGSAGTVYEKVAAVLVPVFEVVTVVIGMLDVGVVLVVGVVDVGVVVPVVLVLVFVPVVGAARLQADKRERIATNAPPVVIPKRCRNCRLENLGIQVPSAAFRVFRTSFSGILLSHDRPAPRYHYPPRCDSFI